MPQGTQLALADAVLAVHVAVILLNVVGMAAIPVGGWCGWRWVRVPWWRALHIAVLALVARGPGSVSLDGLIRRRALGRGLQ